MFSHGFKCPKCGPIPKAKKRTINKKQHDTCPECQSVVTAWERPLKERVGRCRSCGHGSFNLAIYQHNIIRKCKQCSTVINPDTGEILREGECE